MNLRQHFDKALKRNFLGDDVDIKDIYEVSENKGLLDQNSRVVVEYSTPEATDSKFTYNGSLTELLDALSNE